MTWGKRRAIIIVTLFLFFAVIVWLALKPSPLQLANKSVLVIDAGGEIAEQREPDFLSALNGATEPVLHDYTDALDTAAKDSHVTGLIVRISPLATGWGKLEEVRNHLLAFRASHKPSICFLGQDGVGNPEYFLASACEQIWLVPTAPVSIRGMMAQATFFRGTLDKLKVVPEFYHIAERPAIPSPRRNSRPRIAKKWKVCSPAFTGNTSPRHPVRAASIALRLNRS
jgi:hypothetical protein